MLMKKVRYAVVGLGDIAQVAVLPAFHNARTNSQLRALVSRPSLKQAMRIPRPRVPPNVHLMSPTR